MPTLRPPSTLLALFAAAPCLAQTTWFVHPGGPFTTVQAAIGVASPGDRIEVSGFASVPSFLLDKGVEITASAASTPVLVPRIEVVGVPAGQSAHVAGFRLDHLLHGNVSVRNCAGPVLLSRITSDHTNWPVSPGGDPALEITASTSVFVARCTLRGARGNPAGSPAIRIDGSGVFLTSGIAIGGTTISPTTGTGDTGCTGVEILGGDVMIGDYHIEGGWGQPGSVAGGNGGIGLDVLGGHVLVSAASIVYGGSGASPSGSTGLASRGSLRRTADSFFFPAGAGLVTVPARPHLIAPPSIGGGAQLSIAVNGPGSPSQFVFVGLDLAHGHAPLPAFDGSAALTANAVLAAVALDANGHGNLTLPIPFAPAGLHLNLFAQGITGIGGGLLLTAPIVVRID